MKKSFTIVALTLLSLCCFWRCSSNSQEETETIVAVPDSCQEWFKHYDNFFDAVYQKDTLSDAVIIDTFQRAIAHNKTMLCADSLIISAKLHSFIGAILMNAGNHYEAIPYFSTALSYAERSSAISKKYHFTASVYANIMYCYWRIGDGPSNIFLGKKAIDLFRQSGDSTNLSTVMTWYADALADIDSNRLARVYFDSALLYNPYNTEAATQASKFINDLLQYPEGENTDSLEKYLANYIAIAQKIVEDSTEKAELYHTLGKVALRKGEFKKAQDYFNRAKTFARALPPTNPDLIKIDIMLGKVHFAKKELNAADQSFQTAINAFFPNQDPLANNAFPDLTNAPINLWLLDALIEKANILDQQGTADTTIYNQLTQYIHRLQSLYFSEGAVHDLVNNAYKVYEGAIRTALKYGDNEKAFQYAEQAKGVVYRSFLEHRNNLHYAGVPDSLLAKEKQLSLNIYQLSLPDTTATTPNGQTREQALSKAQYEKQQLEANFEKNYPHYYDLKYRPFSPKFKDIAARLSDKQALISYFFGKDTLYTFVVTQQHTKLYTESINADFITDLGNFITAIETDANSAIYLNESHHFYQKLLGKAEQTLQQDNIERLVIVPDGVLCLLSFDVLLTTPYAVNNTNDAQRLIIPYLIKKYAIAYQYTVSGLLDESYTWKNSNAGGLGNNFYSNGGKLYEAEKEAKDVVGLLGGKDYLNNEATYQNMLSCAKKYGVLHLAMHGGADREQPLNSYLILSDGKGGEDILYARRIYGESFDVGLAFFSACESGAGRVVRGEGVISMARAFSFAGCRSLILSLWTLDDITARNITKYFYENINQGMPKDVALQQAKLMNLDTITAEKHIPRYWASLALVGNADPIPTTGVFGRVSTWLGLFAIGSLGLYSWRKRKKK
jgi:CHAT domain-containing protein